MAMATLFTTQLHKITGRITIRNKHIFAFVCLLFLSGTNSIFKCYSGLFASSDILSAGISKLNITPQIPVPIIPFSAREGKTFTGVHDDLFVRCIVFNNGDNKAVLITADIISFPEDIWKEVTTKIQNETGILRENIMLCATHTHSGPQVRKQKITSDNENMLAVNTNLYSDNLIEKIVQVVKEAEKNISPVKIGFGKGECLMNINRRVMDLEGKIKFGNNPYGPVDHDVAVMRIDNLQDKPVAIFFNWPCHGSILGGTNFLISGDWPGVTADYAERNIANGIIALPTAGASGNLNSITGSVGDFISYNNYLLGVIVKDLGEKVINTAKNIQTYHSRSIKASQMVIKLPVKENENAGQKSDIEVRLSVMQIGNIVFAGVSGELFTEIGLKVKELSPYKNTCIITHCNGSCGYIVTDEAHREGGYEVEATRIEKGAEKAIVNNLISMINNL
jgi:neutral ceramidase